MARLDASRCGRCDTVACPPAGFCPHGCGRTMHDERVDGVGTVYASTRVHLPHHELGAPYQVAYVDLPSGARVFGSADPDERLDPGTQVTVTIHREAGAGGEGTRIQLAATGSPAGPAAGSHQ